MDHRERVGDFEAFVGRVEPGLRRALAGHMDHHVVSDALSEAFTYAWEHWQTVRSLENPGGYLFRVAQSKSRTRRQGLADSPAPMAMPSVEPGLAAGMRALSPQQRSVVWLVHGCQWTYRETAEALAISPTAVGTHLQRALTRLRQHLGVTADD
ncbi:MAG TPA: sigma-70 family RNA polymerase sigma factor [Ilumatobacteraceae bacterium]|nr:sigma-70 family RNA polymerase sigma factor [Ilumatobacteraceae bacterium]